MESILALAKASRRHAAHTFSCFRARPVQIFNVSNMRQLYPICLFLKVSKQVATLTEYDIHTDDPGSQA